MVSTLCCHSLHWTKYRTKYCYHGVIQTLATWSFWLTQLDDLDVQMVYLLEIAWFMGEIYIPGQRYWIHVVFCDPSWDIGYRSWSVILAKIYWQQITICDPCQNICYGSWFPSRDIGYISWSMILAKMYWLWIMMSVIGYINVLFGVMKCLFDRITQL